jgi:hypothetical protein
MKVKPEPDGRSELDRALEELLVGEGRVKVDPATGETISGDDGDDAETSALTEPPGPHTIE